jgi:signal transduction histidine kinase
MRTAEPVEESGLEQESISLETAAQEEVIRLQELGRAASFLAHELRQPLGTIQNLVAYLRARVATDDPSVSESLLLLEEQTEFAGQILSSLAGLARTGAAAAIPTNLHRCLKAVLKRMAGHPEIILQQELAPRLPTVLADPVHVDRILSNLISNGLESMPGPGTVIIATRAEASCVLLQVTDAGCGIDPKLAERIFQPFFTTKPSGTGLGLALCRELAEANGGSITFTSRPGHGTTFELRLPRA